MDGTSPLGARVAAPVTVALALCLALAYQASQSGRAPGAPAPVGAQAPPSLAQGYRLAATWDGRTGQGAPGSVLFPAGVDSTDDAVFVVDRANHRLQRFSPDGAFLSAWSQRGSGPRDLLEPRDVAVDGAVAYVTDRGNGRVLGFDATGNVVSTWVVDDLEAPWGIAARDGVVVVTDPDRQVAVVLRHGVVETRISGLREPLGVSIGPDERVYVADRASSEIRIFGLDGAPRGALRTNLAPLDVAVDVLGDLYVQSAGAVLWYPAGSPASRQALYYDGLQGVAVHRRHGVLATVARNDARATTAFHGLVRYRWQPSDGLPQAEWRLRGFPPGRMERPHAVHVGPSGRVWVLDAWPRLQAFDADGRPAALLVPETTTGIVPVDMVEAPSGELLVGESLRLLRVASGGAVVQSLRLGEGTTNYWLTALAWLDALPGVAVLDAAHGMIRPYEGTRALTSGVAWPLAPDMPWQLFWDVAVHPSDGNRVVAVNRTAGELWVFAAGRRVGTWPVEGTPARVAMGPDASVYALSTDGLVRKLTADGTLLAMWDAGAFSAGSSEVVDLAVDAAGRVYTVDRAAAAVHVWERDPEASPEPPLVRPGACRLRADKRARPSALRLGETVTVELQVGGECPSAKPRADIVLAIDRSGSMNAQDQITDTRRAAIAFIDAIDMSRDRVAVVAFNNHAELVQPLTANRDLAVRAVAALEAVGGTDIAAALRLATAELYGANSRPDTQAVIILLTDGRDREPDGALDASAAAQARGARVFTIGFGDVDPMLMVLSASNPEDYFYTPDTGRLTGIYLDIARRITAAVLARELIIVDQLPTNMRYVDGSARPAADYDAGRRTLTWRLADVPFAGATVTFQLEPTQLGRHPTNVRAEAEFVDGLGDPGRLVFPVPEVEVLSLEPTATSTSTPFPTPSPPPTRTPMPAEPLYLPIALRQRCYDEAVHADVAIVMDASSSMELPAADGGPTKLAVAVAAARAFVELLDLPNDQAALVRFDNEALLAQPLTGDREALLRALDQLAPGRGTRIDLGLELALGELSGERHAEGNNRVIVLLTDGRNTGADDSVVLERAQEAKAAGVLIYSIGLGDDVDAALLAQVSSGKGYAFLAPTASELEAIYREIAYTIACANLTWP